MRPRNMERWETKKHEEMEGQENYEAKKHGEMRDQEL